MFLGRYERTNLFHWHQRTCYSFCGWCCYAYDFFYLHFILFSFVFLCNLSFCFIFATQKIKAIMCLAYVQNSFTCIGELATACFRLLLWLCFYLYFIVFSFIFLLYLYFIFTTQKTNTIVCLTDVWTHELIHWHWRTCYSMCWLVLLNLYFTLFSLRFYCIF